MGSRLCRSSSKPAGSASIAKLTGRVNTWGTSSIGQGSCRSLDKGRCVQQAREKNDQSLQLNFRMPDRTMCPHATGITDIIIFLDRRVKFQRLTDVIGKLNSNQGQLVSCHKVSATGSPILRVRHCKHHTNFCCWCMVAENLLEAAASLGEFGGWSSKISSITSHQSKSKPRTWGRYNQILE
ncbi:hypothetical protein BKA80DRAFT_50092 [Phyllosticta citrichinensis]